MEKIIIDTDPGVDDALAIILALSASELEVQAITTVSGNVDLENVTRNAFTILELCQREDIPVYKGAAEPLTAKEEGAQATHGEDGLGNVNKLPKAVKPQEEKASDYLIRAAREQKGELTLVCIGPLTNIAEALEKDKEFAQNIKKLVIMGGAETGGNVTPQAEFNFWHDPEAAKIVFAAGFSDVVMIGLDATKDIRMTPAVREYIHQIEMPAARFIHDITEVFVASQWKYDKILSCEFCDVLITAYLLDENVVDLVPAFVDIETQGLCTGCSVVYRTDRFEEKEANCKVAVSGDTRRFFDLFFRYLFPEQNKYTETILTQEYGR